MKKFIILVVVLLGLFFATSTMAACYCMCVQGQKRWV